MILNYLVTFAQGAIDYQDAVGNEAKAMDISALAIILETAVEHPETQQGKECQALIQSLSETSH